MISTEDEGKRYTEADPGKGRLNRFNALLQVFKIPFDAVEPVIRLFFQLGDAPIDFRYPPADIDDPFVDPCKALLLFPGRRCHRLLKAA